MVAIRKLGHYRALCEMPGCRTSSCLKHEHHPRVAEYEMTWAGWPMGSYCRIHLKDMEKAWETGKVAA